MIRKCLLAAAVASASAVSAHAATIIIDDFDTTNVQVVGAPTFGTPSQNPATTSGPTTDAIGGFRTITAERTGRLGTGDAFGQQVQAVVTGGSAFVSLGSGIAGSVIFSWDPGSVDLVDGTNDSIAFDVLDADLRGNTFTFSVNGGSVTQTANGPGLVSFDFADYEGVDFSDVSTLSLFVSGPASFDVGFDNIRAQAGPISAVPLPAGGLLLLSGLGGIAAINRRKKRAA